MDIAIISRPKNNTIHIEVGGRPGTLDLETGNGILRSRHSCRRVGEYHRITEFSVEQSHLERIRKAAVTF